MEQRFKSRIEGFIIGIIIGIILTLLSFKLSDIPIQDIPKLEISAEVFATIFVGLTVIYFEFIHVVSATFTKSYNETSDGIKYFNIEFLVCLISTQFGLLVSVMKGKGLFPLILLIVSITLTITLTMRIAGYQLSSKKY